MNIYKFYTDNKVELLNTNNLSDLISAKYYSKNNENLQPIGGTIFYIATGTTDKYYVVNQQSLVPKRYWQCFALDKIKELGTLSNLGMGKLNQQKMSIVDWGPKDMCYYCNQQNNLHLGNCTDWHIGSKDELDLLRQSNTVNWFDTNYLWSSSEASEDPQFSAYFWDPNNNQWFYTSKRDYMAVCLIRSF